jgi:regulator of protease activity HflC (stomatin/prohibitin superfamily)
VTTYRTTTLPSRGSIIAAIVTAIVLLLTVIVGSASCSRVEPGHVGIRIRLAGSARGVQNAPIVTGWVVYNPLTEQVIEFPTNVQNIIWTRDVNEGSPVDESITFASSEGVTINADIGLAFHIDGEKAPKLYSRFRERDVLVLAHGYVRNVVREALSEVASQLPVQEIYGSGKTKVIRDALELISARLSPDGFIIDQLSFASALRLPDNVVAAINRAIEATQSAIQSENRVRQTRAEADQAITAARGEAEAARQRARGEADSLLIRARGEAQANEIVRLSMTPEVLQYRVQQRWDGHLPVVTSGTLPMLTVESTRFLALPEAERRDRLRELLGAAQEADAVSEAASPPSTAAPAHPAAAPAAPGTP